MGKKALSEEQIRKMKAGHHLLSVLYRVFILFGLVSFFVVLVITVVLLKILLWLWLIPAGVIALGLVLAWGEFRLYRRLYWPKDVS